MPQASFRFSVRRRPFFCESFSPCRCYASIFFLSVLSYLRFVKRPDPNFGRWTKFLLLKRHLSGIFALFRGGSRSFFTNFPGGNFSAAEISSFSSGKRLDIPCPRCYLSGAKVVVIPDGVAVLAVLWDEWKMMIFDQWLDGDLSDHKGKSDIQKAYCPLVWGVLRGVGSSA